MSSPSRIIAVLFALSPLLLAGCAEVPLQTPRLVFDQEPVEVPRKVIPVWTDTILHTNGKKPTRGFGGRLMFYGSDENKAIEVDGSVIVYAWDDTDSKSLQSPDRKYVFPAEKLSTHYSQSKVGDSYSFWIPWDSVGEPMQKVMLICRFVSKGGGEITSTPAHVVLQGPMAAPMGESMAESPFSNSRDTGIQLMSHESSNQRPRSPNAIRQDQSSTDETIESTTINLPPGFLERNSSGTVDDGAAGAATETTSNPLIPLSGSVWSAETLEPGQRRESDSRSIPRRARKTPVAQRLADRARSQPRRSESQFDPSRSRGSNQTGISAGHILGHSGPLNASAE